MTKWMSAFARMAALLLTARTIVQDVGCAGDKIITGGWPL